MISVFTHSGPNYDGHDCLKAAKADICLGSLLANFLIKQKKQPHLAMGCFFYELLDLSHEAERSGD